MKLSIYQVDAFTGKVFSGNPAAVCPLSDWLDDALMQNIAMENNLAETAFYVKVGSEYHIRWFTPAVEVDLCGHATLAAAFVIFNHENHQVPEISFYSHRSGKLSVRKHGDFLTLNFPTDSIEPVEPGHDLTAGLSMIPVEAYKGKTDYMLIFENETQVKELIPDMNLVKKIKARGIIVTSPGDEADFVSRFFAPQSGIDEDPVTGSAHTTLIPYWAQRLGKNELTAMQLSQRKGWLRCKHLGDRVEISGQARLYMAGEICLDDK